MHPIELFIFFKRPILFRKIQIFAITYFKFWEPPKNIFLTRLRRKGSSTNYQLIWKTILFCVAFKFVQKSPFLPIAQRASLHLPNVRQLPSGKVRHKKTTTPHKRLDGLSRNFKKIFLKGTCCESDKKI